MNTDQSIIAQNAANVAAQLMGPLSFDEPLDLDKFDKIRKHVFEGTLALAGSAPAPVQVQQPLPQGAIAPPPSASAQQLAPTGNQIIATAGPMLQNGVDYDSATVLADYRAHPDQYWDNRESKKKPTQPDFRHKTLVNAKGYNHGAWLPKD